MMMSLLCSLGATIAEGVASDGDLVHRFRGFLGRGASLPEAAQPILRRMRNRTDHPNERCQRLFGGACLAGIPWRGWGAGMCIGEPTCWLVTLGTAAGIQYIRTAESHPLAGSS